MPSNQFPLGALPQRFRQSRLLIVGCGDVGLRVVRQMPRPQRIMALTSSSERVGLLRAYGITPLVGNLDEPASLRRLAGLAQRVVHLAPTCADGQVQGQRDLRTQHLVQALRRRSLPRQFVYGSTSGVYGDCQGERVMESRVARPQTARARRRVDAERAVRQLGRGATRASILRIPGIYATDREGGTPRARLERAMPVLSAQDDVYTNHIHADDLARACLSALYRGAAQRAYNVCDDSHLKMGDYFDLAADLYGLPRPRRISREAAAGELSTTVLSFMSESRQLDNTRMKRELRLVLHYGQVHDGLQVPYKPSGDLDECENSKDTFDKT